jgi:hypothetical protein
MTDLARTIHGTNGKLNRHKGQDYRWLSSQTNLSESHWRSSQYCFWFGVCAGLGTGIWEYSICGIDKERSKLLSIQQNSTSELFALIFIHSLEIADLMRRVLTKSAFISWFNAFYTKEGIANRQTAIRQ